MSLQKYSVLMSVYAKEKPEFLRESMMSMYEQTVPTDDFVLICDGPLNEGLDSVINEMSRLFGGRLRVFRFSENRGLGYALKFGVEKCKNELIARMDSDDVSVKDRCEKELGGFEKNSDLAVVGSNIVEYDEKMKKTLGVREVPETDEEIRKYAKRRNPMNHMSVMFKKSKVLKAGNYQDMPGFEDYYLWVRMMQNGCRFLNVQRPLMMVRGGSEMMRRRGGIQYIRRNAVFQKSLRKLNITNTFTMVLNCLARTTIALVPRQFREVFYQRVLRKKNESC